MKYFEATLIARGRKEIHHLTAADRREAMAIAQSGGMVVRVRELPMPLSARWAVFQETVLERLFAAPIGMQEWIVAVRQMGVMLGAGISLSDALSEAASATRDKRARAIILKALEDVEAGMSLSASLEKNRAALGNVTMAMVALGEKTGTLADAMLKLAELLEELRDNRAKVKKAMRTPMLSLGAMGVAFVVLILLVVPKFKAMFSRLGSDLPLPTQILLGIEYALTNYGLFILALLAGTVFGHRWLMNNRPFYRLGADRLLLRVYLVGRLVSLGFYGRFMLIFSQLIRAGIPLTEAMATAAGTIENNYVRQKLSEAARGIEQGKQLSAALDETGLFEPMVLQMIRSGESSGELDTMLGRVADYYKMRFNHLVDNFSALLEPILMAFIAALVLLIALGIFLPMWEISNAAMKR